MHGLKHPQDWKISSREKYFYKNIKDLFEQKFEHNVDCKWQAKIIHELQQKLKWFI